jgi:DNA-binding MarR family transcriptional regulator
VQEQPIGLLLGQICRLNHGHMHALLEDLGLYRGQPFVLRTLDEEDGLSHSELARRMHVTPATVSHMVRRMERTGFVERRDDPEDQRVSRVYLTDRGRATRDQLHGVWEEVEAEALEGFTLEERVLLRRFLLQVRDNLVRAYGEIEH